MEPDEAEAGSTVSIKHMGEQTFYVYFPPGVDLPEELFTMAKEEDDNMVVPFVAARSADMEDMLRKHGFDIMYINFDSYSQAVPDVFDEPEEVPVTEEIYETFRRGRDSCDGISGSVFISGETGSGKTKVIAELAGNATAMGDRVRVVATTKQGARVLRAACPSHQVGTLNSLFGFRRDDTKLATGVVLDRVVLQWAINKTPQFDVLFIDGILTKWMFEMVLAACRRINKKMRFVVASDVAQMFVYTDDDDAIVAKEYCFESDMWDSTFGDRMYCLKTNHVVSNRHHLNILRRARIGAEQQAMDIDHLKAAVVPPTINTVRLMPSKGEATKHNNIEFGKLDGAIRKYKVHIMASKRTRKRKAKAPADEEEEEEDVIPEYTFKSLGTVPEPLRERADRIAEWASDVEMKRGARVRCIDDGLTGTVERLEDNQVVVRLDHDDSVRAVVMRPTASFTEKVPKIGTVTVSIMCMPLELCWAATAYMLQGWFVPGLQIDLSDFFNPGQLYVGLGRSEHIEILDGDFPELEVDERVVDFLKDKLPRVEASRRERVEADRDTGTEELMGEPYLTSEKPLESRPTSVEMISRWSDLNTRYYSMLKRRRQMFQ